jgi:hypothetical protein
VVLVEVVRKAYLASIVPVIVNVILNEHQVVVDIVAFVARGDFPRSRLGEKQRGKILASWVTRKLRTIAQFGIRDPESVENQIAELPEDGDFPTSTRASMIVSQTMTSGPEAAEVAIGQSSHAHHLSDAPYENSTLESPPGFARDADTTPTATKSHHFEGQIPIYTQAAASQPSSMG